MPKHNKHCYRGHEFLKSSPLSRSYKLSARDGKNCEEPMDLVLFGSERSVGIESALVPNDRPLSIIPGGEYVQ